MNMVKITMNELDKDLTSEELQELEAAAGGCSGVILAVVGLAVTIIGVVLNNVDRARRW